MTNIEKESAKRELLARYVEADLQEKAATEQKKALKDALHELLKLEGEQTVRAANGRDYSVVLGTESKRSWVSVEVAKKFLKPAALLRLLTFKSELVDAAVKSQVITEDDRMKLIASIGNGHKVYVREAK